MKNKIIIMLITLSAFVVGCTTGGYESPEGSLSDVGFYTSEGTSQILEKNMFDYMSFSDLSLGAVNHAWTIEKGDAFLEGPITRTQRFTTFRINNEGDTVSNDKTVHVLFRESGLKKVRLYNEYNDSVTFRGYRDGAAYNWPSTKVGDKWVIDTTFVVKVYDTIVPDIVVKYQDQVVDHTSEDTIYVEAGEILNMVDNTTIGEPTGRNFFVRTPIVEGDAGSGKNIAGSPEQDANLILKKLGIFEGGVNVNRTGETIPGDSETYIFPAPIKVIPSTKPFQLTGNIKELEDETIQVPFNGEFVPVAGKEDFFEVKVNDVVFPIQSVAVSDVDATLINIKLVDPIFRPDVITVTMKEGSDMLSTDTRTPVVFMDQPVVMHNVNLFPADVANSNLIGKWWRNSAHVELSTEQFAVGTKSLKMTILPGEATAEAGYKFPNIDQISLEAGATYTLKYKVYIDSANSPNLALNTSVWFLNDWGWNGNATLGDIETDKWVEIERKYTRSPRDIVQIWIRLLAGGDNSAETTIYMDDFFLIKDEVRPAP